MKRKLKRPETAYDNITIQFVATVQLNSMHQQIFIIAFNYAKWMQKLWYGIKLLITRTSQQISKHFFFINNNLTIIMYKKNNKKQKHNINVYFIYT